MKKCLWGATAVFLFVSFVPASVSAEAAKGKKKSDTQVRAEIANAPIRIDRKPNQTLGEAVITYGGKLHKVATRAAAAWKARGGEAALVLVAPQSKRSITGEYVLRYYDLESGRSRVLGPVPILSGSIVETKAQDEHWAFALCGTMQPSGQTGIVVGSDSAVPGRLPDSDSPMFRESGDTRTTELSYVHENSRRQVPLGYLLGASLHDIYTVPPDFAASLKYLQIGVDGQTTEEFQDGSLFHGSWTSDGQSITIIEKDKHYALPIEALRPVQGVPARQRFGVRLTQELSSRSTHENDEMKAISITPVVVNGEILIPQGSKLEGKVVQANSVGWGFKHETASLTVRWSKITTPAGDVLDLDARVYAVENAQEKVDDKGKIRGVRSTGTLGHSAENYVLSLAGIDPAAYLFAASSGSAVLGFAEPEILYPAGTELILEVQKPLITSKVYEPAVRSMANDAAGQQNLQQLVDRLPFRTTTKGSNKPSDLTNLVFVGTLPALRRAFAAAGWVQTDDLHAASTFGTIKAVSGNQNYTQAPMSTLLLGEQEPLLTLSKTTNTFSSRHHLRIFSTGERYRGEPVFTSSSTQDIGIAFSRKQKTFIHVIDEHIDNERSKVVNDLVFTECIESLDMVDRPRVPHDAYNSTGDRLLTDGKAAVMRINNCDNPRTTPSEGAEPAGRAERITRNTALTVRNDLYRGNLVYSGIDGIFKVRNYLRSSRELEPDAGTWRKTDPSGADYKGLGQNPGLQHRSPTAPEEAPTQQDLAEVEREKTSHRWDPPRYEFALQGGYMHMRESYLSAVGVLEESSDPDADAYFIFLADDVSDGWAAGGSITVNSWRHFSNEFSYFRQQVKYRLGTVNAVIPPNTNVILDDSDIVSTPIGLVTRQAEYNLLIHPTVPASRWRPYAAVGPVLQLVALNGAPLKKPAGVYNLGLKNIGLIKAAFDFGNTAPLDGGGIFHVGLQYGGGVKYRVTPRIMLRADWRETWAKNPDIIARSYEDYEPSDLNDTYSSTIIRVGPERKFLNDRYTLGVAFAF